MSSQVELKNISRREESVPAAVKTTDKLDLDDRMYHRLVAAIVEKSLRPGEQLNEMQLAAANGLSRPRLRRVLERLKLEGVIEFKPNRGAFISRPSVKEAYDVFEARAHLESIVFTLACERATVDDIKRLREHIELERKTYKTGKVDFNHIAGDFHVLVAEIIDNSVILEQVKSLIHRVCLIQSLYETDNTVLCLVDEHEQLVNLIEAQDAGQCVTELIHHCEHILSSLDLTDQRNQTTDIYQNVL